jgi:glycosyltransferase involved in cell wall biosynthesis
MRLDSVSVCMTVFNGEKFILKQIESILIQLTEGDELIIIDDASDDDSFSIIDNLDSSLIKAVKNPFNVGVNKSFEKAINISKNPFIILSDQDDIWTLDRLDTMIKSLTPNYHVVVGNQTLIDVDDIKIEKKMFDVSPILNGRLIYPLFKIFLGNIGYYGCTMAFKSEFKNLILPFPNHIESHDLWIAMAGLLSNQINHINDVVLFRRIHDNLSLKKRSLLEKIFSRGIMFYMLIILLKRRTLKHWR